MRSLVRIAEPPLLSLKKDVWLARFIAKGDKRPPSSQYGHSDIRSDLNSISHRKCFYCETKLLDKPSEVDHHIEVACDKDLAFCWENLYLSCDNCNSKIDHSRIPIDRALDPCRNSDQDIEKHLSFEDELITAVDGSILGLTTIQKYKLDTDELDLMRLRELKKFWKVLDRIRIAQTFEGRRGLTGDEESTLRKFANADQPYSLMFKSILKKANIKI